MFPMTEPPSPEELLAANDLPSDALQTTGLVWDELLSIAKDHEERSRELEDLASYVAQRLRTVKQVHSIRYRVKDRWHLVAKIIRKRIDRSESLFTLETYRNEITDLAGIRALHLFKHEWGYIHDFIMHEWEPETPEANIREGDKSRELCESMGCKVKVHPAGYRSVHYLVKPNVSKHKRIVEVQVRTIFEEGWSEIDHRVRYPRNLNNPVLSQYLDIFNVLAGGADSMGTYVNDLQSHLTEKDRQISKLVKELEEAVSKADISRQQKDELEAKVQKLSNEVKAKPHLTISAAHLGQLATDAAYWSVKTPTTVRIAGEYGLDNKCSICGKPLPTSSGQIHICADNSGFKLWNKGGE